MHVTTKSDGLNKSIQRPGLKGESHIFKTGKKEAHVFLSEAWKSNG